VSDPADRLLIGIAIAAATMAGGAIGALTQSHFDAIEAKKIAAEISQDRQRERAAAAGKESDLNAIINRERKDHESENRERARHVGALTSRNAWLRDEVSGARASGAACLSRLDGIAEGVAGLEELVAEGERNRAAAESLRKQALGAAVKAEAENERLASQLAGLQQRERERHPEQITVTGKR
jgi:hypothetical protein